MIKPLCYPIIFGSHLIFVDGLVIFVGGDHKNAECLQVITKCFGKFSRLNMNGMKSSLIASKSIDVYSLSEVLGITPTKLSMRYLGLSLFTGRLTRSLCQPLIDKIVNKLDSWKSRLLFMDGGVELVIYTLLAYSIYWSSVFLLPVSVSEEIDKLCQNFI